jgi:hypothetical protein
MKRNAEVVQTALKRVYQGQLVHKGCGAAVLGTGLPWWLSTVTYEYILEPVTVSEDTSDTAASHKITSRGFEREYCFCTVQNPASKVAER